MEPPTKQDLTALVVDDSAAIRQLVVAILQQLGVKRVLEAGDGIAAFRALDQAGTDVDLIFCDLQMPGVDGVDTLRGLATRRLSASIVLLSGMDPKLMTTVAGMAEQLGLPVLGTLRKPFQPDQIQEMLDLHRRTLHTRRLPHGLRVSPEELDDALTNSRIEVYYQPQVRMTDSAVIGVEALVRMHHPVYGMIDPGSFVSVAEESGRIGPLTMLVLKESIAQAGRWRKAGLPLRLSVNLSVLALRRLDLPEMVLKLTSEAGLLPGQLTLELTESQISQGADMLHIVSRFRLRDFKLSIDDYGTGHSGLHRLKNLPFTELKIDKSFVHGASRDEDLRSILETSIDLGHRLRMEVVAEGIEDWDDWQLLRTLGCDVAQGYAASPALPAEEVGAWASRWNAAGPTPRH